ncbi:MAG: proline dehydrogenase family protein [Phycisphaerae bacterium]
MHVVAPYESRIREIGREIFDRAQAAQPRVWQADFWADLGNRLAMQDEALKVQAFRFVDALPAMADDADIAAHLKEYMDPAHLRVPAPLRLALSFDRPDSQWARSLGRLARRAALAMANRFITGSDPFEAATAVEAKRRQGLAFTLDVLGEAAISEQTVERYTQTYIDLIEHLGPAAQRWPEIPRIDRDRQSPMPRVNVSVKLTCMDTHFDPIDPAGAIDRAGARLRSVLRVAQRHGAFVNVDMESFAVCDLTFELFKAVLSEPEFRDWPYVGIVVQAYLRRAEADLRQLLEWVQHRGTPIGIRLVKGAYWDHETILAEQNGTAPPVWTRKWESDVCFEKLTRILLEHHRSVRPAFASHNVRSLAHALACAEHLGLSSGDYEVQMLHGMGDPLKKAVAQMQQCLRIYCPCGDMIAGMAYLVRRLLENTSNDSFLRQSFGNGRSTERLLHDPGVIQPPSAAPTRRYYQDTDEELDMGSFRNTPTVSFADPDDRRQMSDALANVRASLGSTYPMIIDGQDVPSDDTFDSVNPAKPAEIIGRVAKASTRHVDQAVAAAGGALDTWRNMPPAQRSALLGKLADEMERQRFELAALMVLEVGKTWRDAVADVAEGADYIRYYAQRAELLARRPRRRDLPGETNVLLYEPCGVCAVLAPFCFPIAILAGMSGAALAAGNTVIIKPSSAVPVTAARWVRMAHQVGIAAGVVNFLPGPGQSVGAHLVQHPQVHAIAFTGSKDVGLPLIESAVVTRPDQHHLKRVVADLGGKNATIVDADAELDEAVQGVLASAFAFAGQRCSACSRVMVVDRAYDAFCHKLVEATRTLVLGDPASPGTQVGPVIDPASVHRCTEAIVQGRRDGRLLYQADVSGIPGGGHYVGPAIVADADPGSTIAREEVFGPVLTVIQAADFDQALHIANDSPYALTGGVYSRSPAHLDRARREFRVGNLYINRKITGSRVDIQPFGGFKLSGTATGKAGGPDYLLQFCVARTITENALRHGFAPTEETAHSPG